MDEGAGATAEALPPVPFVSLTLKGAPLAILPREGVRSLGLAVLAGLGFGLFMALADATLFASAVPESQHELLRTTTLVQRLGGYAVGATTDELALRLLALPALVGLVSRLRGRCDAAAWWSGIVVVAVLVWPLTALRYFTHLDWTLLGALRELVLHGGAGVLWGWLAWRHGWSAGLAGHLSAHLALQPLLAL